MLWGNRVLEQALDAELPKLLSSEIGIPVTLAPTKTGIVNLRVFTPRLVMGDPANPALVATGVTVSLAWSDLLRGEIRLRRASGETLVVEPLLWPTNDDPWPTDYRFLDPYLPDFIELRSARYVDDEGDSYTFSSPQWQRRAAASSLKWQDNRGEQALDITVDLTSLSDLLRLARLQLQITTAPSGKSG